MESNIALKLKALDYSQEIMPTANKFVSSLLDDVVSLEETVQIINYLNDNGIKISKPSQHKILAGGFSFVQNQVEEMKKIGELGAYIEDPVRINSKGAIQRIMYLRSLGEPYKTPEGKYAKLPFRKKDFDAKYGIEYLNGFPIAENIAPVKSSPVVEMHKVTEIIHHNSKDGEVADVVNEVKDPIIEILSKPQTIGLNDETFERYERLAEGIRHVMITVYGISEVNDNIIDNLIKLVANEVEDDSKVIYSSITFGKAIAPEEEMRLKSAISEELEYTSILDINLGGMAAWNF